MAMVEFANGSAGTFEATRFGIGCKNQNAFAIHARRRDAPLQPRAAQPPGVPRRDRPVDRTGPRDLLVTDMKHPIFGNFWRPGHIIGYEHTFIATLAEFLDCLSRDEDFHPNFADALAMQQALDAMLRSSRTRQWTTSRR